ncbi:MULTISPECIES: hypothetical protein [Streptomyces]|uniref:Uncharacterized protein n=1 Tax=Streptomyces fradiae ATCC 10745 = DSM 40063 TaxID=1319510 RepID=A0A1Y2NTY6_STRFR|nr:MULTISPECIES: hypothetical protein [Streptomyces]KAF0651734.1 hypothetical protein K701_02010 [Streptomyces fradiae ATCC 10745 = DSM 40063]OSY50790.1 hypothetical protein BG846_03588 [Streptomyces fradiae ATCC 10745 = DSM 40063]QEV11161.1 hypothetical protein CP974_03085 [Streptomyces fradiae ATCC 10745 = DSM 40063]
MAHAPASHTTVTLTVRGSEIIPGDLLAVRDWSAVEEIGSRRDGTTSLHVRDGGIRIVGDTREYTVRREITPAPSPSAVLAVGPCATDDDRANLDGFAFDVCDQLCVSAVPALHSSYNVRDFAALYVWGPVLGDDVVRKLDPVAAVLMAEALAYGVEVRPMLRPSECARCLACGQGQTVAKVVTKYGEAFCVDCRGDAAGCAWCGSDVVTNPVDVGGTWVPMCSPCEARHI